MDRFAIEVQHPRAVAGGAQITHRTIAIVAAPEMQSEQGEPIGNRFVGHALQCVTRDAMQGGAGTRQQTGVHRLLHERVAEMPDPGGAAPVAPDA